MKSARNAPCPCGSGRKFKHCCAQAQVASPASGSAESAPALLQRANELLQQGAAAAAVEGYQRALQLDPALVEAHNNLGIAWQSMGRIDQAVASYRAALEQRPQFPEAHNNLGNALRLLGDNEAGIASFQRALSLRPDYPEALGNLGNALREAGQLEQARECLQRALSLASLPELHNSLGNVWLDMKCLSEAASSYRAALQARADYLEARSNLGAVLLELGQYEECARIYQELLLLRPDYAEAHNNLGNAQRGLGQLEAAAASYRRALWLKPELARAHGNLGGVLRLLGEPQQAEASCRAALELDPRLATTVALLAELHADRGEFDQAEALLHQALAIEPVFPQALAGLARYRTFTRADGQWLRQAQRLLERSLPAQQEVYLRYAIGKYFDDLSEHAAAFASFERANELSRGLKPAYRPEQLQEAISLLMRTQDRPWLAQMQKFGVPSLRPVLIVGMPRSGTTLLEQILSSHPLVHGAGELAYWERAFARFVDAGACEQPALVHGLAEDYLSLLQRLGPEAQQVIDKMPGNFQYLGLIHAALPFARIVHLQRDALDTCLSIYCQHFEHAPAWTNELTQLAHYYQQYQRLMQHWRQLLPRSVFYELRYEDLVADPERHSRALLGFLGLPWDARCLEFNRSQRAVITASKWQVRQRVTRASVGRAQAYARELAPLRAALQLASAPAATP